VNSDTNKPVMRRARPSWLEGLKQVLQAARLR
jgi:hypothetical protein